MPQLSQAWLQEGIAWQHCREGINLSTWDTRVWPVHGWSRPWMWQSKHDSILRRHLHCDLCLPPQCFARLTALYHVLVRCYKTTEVDSLNAYPKLTSYTVHGRAPCKRKVGTCPEPSIKLPVGGKGRWPPIAGLFDAHEHKDRHTRARHGQPAKACGTVLPTPPPPAPVRSLGQVLPAPPPCPEWLNCVGSMYKWCIAKH